MHIKIERKIKGELQHIKKALRKTKSIHFYLRIVYLLNASSRRGGRRTSTLDDTLSSRNTTEIFY